MAAAVATLANRGGGSVGSTEPRWSPSSPSRVQACSPTSRWTRGRRLRRSPRPLGVSGASSSRRSTTRVPAAVCHPVAQADRPRGSSYVDLFELVPLRFMILGNAGSSPVTATLTGHRRAGCESKAGLSGEIGGRGGCRRRRGSGRSRGHALTLPTPHHAPLPTLTRARAASSGSLHVAADALPTWGRSRRMLYPRPRTGSPTRALGVRRSSITTTASARVSGLVAQTAGGARHRTPNGRLARLDFLGHPTEGASADSLV